MRFDVSFPDSVTHTFLKEIETLLSDYPEPRFKPDALLDAATLAGMEDLQQQRMQQQRKKHQQARHQRLQALMSDDGSAAVVLQDSEVFSDDAAGPAPWRPYVRCAILFMSCTVCTFEYVLCLLV